MDRYETLWVVIGVCCFLFGLYYVEIFPDPYHQEGNVNIYKWLWRELDALLDGEK